MRPWLTVAVVEADDVALPPEPAHAETASPTQANTSPARETERVRGPALVAGRPVQRRGDEPPLSYIDPPEICRALARLAPTRRCVRRDAQRRSSLEGFLYFSKAPQPCRRP